MRTSYIFGFLLVICTAIANMAMAQQVIPSDPVKRKNFLQEIRMARANNQKPPIAVRSRSFAAKRMVQSGPKESTLRKAAALQQLLADGKNKSGKSLAAPPAYFTDKQRSSFRTSPGQSRMMQQNSMQTASLNTPPSDETRNRNHEIANQRDLAKQERSRKMKILMEERLRNQQQRVGEQ